MMRSGLCPKCYTSLESDAAFCHECGSPQGINAVRLRRKRALGPFVLIVGALGFAFILYLIGALTFDPERDFSLVSGYLILLPLLAGYSLIMLVGIVYQVRPELPIWRATGHVLRRPWLIPGLLAKNLSLVLGSIIGFVGGITALCGAVLLFELLPLGLVLGVMSGDDRSEWVVQGAAQEFLGGGLRSVAMAMVMLVGGVVVASLGVKMAKAGGQEDS